MPLTSCFDEQFADYSTVVIFLHGAGGTGQEASELLRDGFFGDDFTDMKFIFPTTTMPDGNWYETYDGSEATLIENCFYTEFEKCSYNLLDMDISGKEIAAVI